MKAYFNKAIMFKEFKNAISFAMVFALYFQSAYVIGFSAKIEKMKMLLNKKSENYLNIMPDYVTSYRGNFSGMAFIAILTITLCYVIYGMDRKKNYDILSTMPITRTQILNSKFLIALLTFLVPYIISVFMMFGLYFGSYNIIAPYLSFYALLYVAIIEMLVGIFVITFFQLFHVICGNGQAATILGTISLIFTIGFCGILHKILESILYIFLGNSYQYRTISSSLRKILQYISPVDSRGLTHLDKKIISGRTNIFMFKAFILVFLIITIFFLSSFLFRKNKNERNGNILMFYSLEPIFKLGVAICFGMLSGVIATKFFNAEVRYMVYIISFGLISILTYCICGKTFKAFKL